MAKKEDSIIKSENTDLSSKKEEESVEKTPIKKEEPKKDNQAIIYAVIGPDGNTIYSQKIVNTVPMSVEDLLIQSGLDLDVRNGFINGISGIQNEGMSGWVFEVNNAPLMVPASEYIVNPTDQIKWKYVDFSKMMQPQTEEMQMEEPMVGRSR